MRWLWLILLAKSWVESDSKSILLALTTRHVEHYRALSFRQTIVILQPPWTQNTILGTLVLRRRLAWIFYELVADLPREVLTVNEQDQADGQ